MITIIRTLYIYIYIYIHTREHGYEDPWLFFEAKRGPRAKESLENPAVVNNTLNQQLRYQKKNHHVTLSVR